MTRSERAAMARAICRQTGISMQTVYRNRLCDLPRDARLIMIEQILRLKANLHTRTVAKKRRGSLASLGMPTVYRRSQP